MSMSDEHDKSHPPLLAEVLAQRICDPIEDTQKAIARIAAAWKELDREYGVCPAAGSKRLKRSVSIPKSLQLGRIRDVCTPDVLLAAQIEGLEEEQRNAYCQKLSSLFRQIPLLKEALDHQAKHDTALSQLSSSDIGVIPELESPHEMVPAASEPVYTFGVYHIRTHALQQKVQVLGKQRLTDLCQAIHCLQDYVGYQNPSCPFFYLGNCFYEDRTKSAHSSTSDILQWMQSTQSSSSSSTSTASSPATNPAPFVSSLGAAGPLPAGDGGSRKPSRVLPASHAALAKALLEQMQATPSQPMYSKRKRPTPLPSTSAATSPPITVLPMQEAMIEQLPWEVGRKVLYCHQHGCEHWVCLLDVQQPCHVAEAAFATISGAKDSTPLSRHESGPSSQCDCAIDFPRQVFRATPRKRRCEVCEAFAADYIVYRDRLASAASEKHQLASFMCQTCFQMLHYGTDGNLLYDDFLVFPFPQFSVC